METQLQLLDTPKDWRLDEKTREIGRQGVQTARQALEAAQRVARVDHRSAA